ncbi:unnamed protein product [Gongylonema pulchrum]|uniref:RNA-dependent RNA polymerase n=1 Tax=Gongylonema pulchrum TaxID=637853 RepID=A0A183E0R9_9BILA|nr:unnamed protein product [Gongylonema pulchrum]
MQPYMEVRNIDKIFDELKAVHQNINITWLGIGNMPNMGIFFVRGEYITRYNENSNKTIINWASETKLNNAAGGHPLLSWANLEHDKRILTIYFAIENFTRAHDGLAYSGYKFIVPYSSFYTVVVDCNSDASEGDNYVYICLRHPPQSVLAGSLWLGFSIPKGVVKPQNMFPDETVEWQRRARDADLTPTKQLFEILARWSRRAKCQIQFAAVLKVPRREINADVPDLPSFRANYAVQALLSRGSVVKDQLFDVSLFFRDFLFKRIQYAAEECLLACEETLDCALAAIDERRRISFLNFFEHVYMQKLNLFRRISAGEEDIDCIFDLPHNCVFIRKILATPLRLLLLPPEVMMTNRVVRHFGEEYALRCVFRDDNGQRLVPKEFTRGRALQDQSLMIPDLVYRVLGTGLRIASRHYQFLAWSNSQMRDGGCYLYSDSVVYDKRRGAIVYTIEDIRRWMGDFTTSKSVPKLMSRMGQCFTQAQVVQVNPFSLILIFIEETRKFYSSRVIKIFGLYVWRFKY